jgi:hypothetical protein
MTAITLIAIIQPTMIPAIFFLLIPSSFYNKDFQSNLLNLSHYLPFEYIICGLAGLVNTPQGCTEIKLEDNCYVSMKTNAIWFSHEKLGKEPIDMSDVRAVESVRYGIM